LFTTCPGPPNTSVNILNKSQGTSTTAGSAGTCDSYTCSNNPDGAGGCCAPAPSGNYFTNPIEGCSTSAIVVNKFSGTTTTVAGTPHLNGYADGNPSKFNDPTDLCIDNTNTNLYVADTKNHVIRKIVIDTGVVSTLASGFSFPQGITINSTGTRLYVSDTNHHTIRVIDISTAAVTTLSGGTSVSDYIDGTTSSARFSSPIGLTLDSTDSNLYIVDSGNEKIRKINLSSGIVSTLVGSGDGAADGSGSSGSFFKPSRITIDSTDSNLYITDTNNNLIRKVNISSRATTTIAGLNISRFTSTSKGEFTDGIGRNSAFKYPAGITIDSTDTNLYITDRKNNRIRKINISTGQVSSFGVGDLGHMDGNESTSKFWFPSAITYSAGALYIVDEGNHIIRKITMV
jgi:DNA-binding beta-propeller fold protein YncE